MSNSKAIKSASHMVQHVVHKTESGHHLHLPIHQAGHVPKESQIDIITIPANQLLAFGLQSVIDFREKDVILKNLTLEIGYTALSGTTSSSTVLNPANLWFDKIQLFIGGKQVQQIYGIEQFISKNIFQLDDERIYENTLNGLYSDSTARQTKFASSGFVYINISSLFDITDVHQVHNGNDIQLRIFMNSLASQIDKTSGTPTMSITSTNLLAKVQRVAKHESAHHKMEISKVPRGHKFLETLNMTVPLSSGSSTYTTVLSGITGKCAFLYFIIRPSSYIGSDYFTFLPISSFELYDAQGKNISTGTTVQEPNLRLNLSRQFGVESSYLTEKSNGAYMYLWSFSEDACETYKTGRDLGSHYFTGNERLKINFDAATTSIHALDIFAFTHNILLQGPTGFEVHRE